MIHDVAVQKSSDLLFTKYSIKAAADGREYHVYKYDDNGLRHEVVDAIEKGNILSGRALKGAIGFTKDKNHRSGLHFFLYFAQLIHELVTGRWRKWNPEGIWKKSYAASCHGYIVTGEALDRQGRPLPVPGNMKNECYHPMMMVDPVFPGVLMYARDNVKDPDITTCYFYMPRDAALSEQIRASAIKSALPKESAADASLPVHEWKYYQPGCLTDVSQKINFSKKKLLACLTYNGKKLVEKKPQDRISKTTALLVADLLLSPDAVSLKDENGEKRSFFCCSYVTTMLQGSLFMRNLQGVSPQEIAEFKRDVNGDALDRKRLQAKILRSFASGNTSESHVAKIFHQTFHSVKFARADGEYFSSGRFVELADKCSFAKPSKLASQV